ncbi:MAG: hypothetical protein M0Q40_08880 [Limnochordia bacterium]|jgi:hypothetical protein|nr:hypothetical protein [Limnochordia bacterium]MDD4517400.1 hypothetical protein [Limnochordia bacterium]
MSISTAKHQPDVTQTAVDQCVHYPKEVMMLKAEVPLIEGTTVEIDEE